MSVTATTHIAIDLGAESGRVMLGRVDPAAGRIGLEEAHRFPTPCASVLGSLRWDLLGIYAQIISGLRKAARHAGGAAVSSVGVDSWGVDYVLLKHGHPHLTPAFMYRDPRTDAVSARVQGDEPLRRLVFQETGIQFLHFNTLYQLLADLEHPAGRALHEAADGMLLTGDYFNYLLCGVARAERSLASTSQLYNPRTRDWSERLVETFGLRRALLPELADAGTTLGPLTGDIAGQTGLHGAVVVATCSHDTAAAVAATPLAADGASAYLSSGTWSLLGVELAEPIITDECRELGFTNEVGFGHSIRLLKNISGLFIVQECRKGFLGDAGGEARELEYAALAEAARGAEPLRSLIRPDAAPFGKVGEMPRKIADYCRRTHQPVPETPAQFVRCVYDSLALLYARTLAQIERLTSRTITRLHVVGGGSRAAVLNQITADACGIVVEAGPAEATALGNIGVQAIAAGTLAGLPELRALVARSFPPQRFSPTDARYRAAGERFAALPVAGVA